MSDARLINAETVDLFCLMWVIAGALLWFNLSPKRSWFR